MTSERNHQQFAVVLRKFDGLSYDEISRIMGCSVPGGRIAPCQAKRTLRDKLLPDGS